MWHIRKVTLAVFLIITVGTLLWSCSSQSKPNIVGQWLSKNGSFVRVLTFKEDGTWASSLSLYEKGRLKQSTESGPYSFTKGLSDELELHQAVRSGDRLFDEEVSYISVDGDTLVMDHRGTPAYEETFRRITPSDPIPPPDEPNPPVLTIDQVCAKSDSDQDEFCLIGYLRLSRFAGQNNAAELNFTEDAGTSLEPNGAIRVAMPVCSPLGTGTIAPRSPLLMTAR